MRAHSINNGVVILTSYFKKYPQYQVFPAFKDVPLHLLAANKKFQAHSQNIMNTLRNSIDAMMDFIFDWRKTWQKRSR
ncbi:hypothetical protein ANTPLA_LOCUS3923 [Anthophora plagiata]